MQTITVNLMKDGKMYIVKRLLNTARSLNVVSQI